MGKRKLLGLKIDVQRAQSSPDVLLMEWNQQEELASFLNPKLEINEVFSDEISLFLAG